LNNIVLNTIIQEFINDNLNSDIHHLLLKGFSFEGVETREVIAQIEAKIRCKSKLPTWFNTKNVYYPNKLNIEQSSSEITAQYKSQLILGHSVIDITGGFGVDCFYFSKQFKNIIHCEIDEELSQIVNQNFKQFNITNIIAENVDGIKYLKNTTNLFDWIFVDPSRRHDTKGKVFTLKDCQPNIPEHIELLFKHTNNILIKTSPLLDITVGIEELKYVKTIHVVAVNNEVKELLWILEKDYADSIAIKTINLKKEKKEHFNFKLTEELSTKVNYSLPLSYLYEPNSAILKAGAFKSISYKFQLSKLHQHSHLYTSDKLVDFPGRTFSVNKIIPYSKKNIKCLKSIKANITTRNFPETVQQIRKKLNIKEGGNIYIFFTTNVYNDKIIIITNKA
jgi:16S rRNA G966 N2-methylase RsmD